MDSFEVNKILGAVLGTLTFTLGLSIASEIALTPHRPATPGYDIAVPDAPGAGAGPAAATVAPIGIRLASADPAKGQALTRQCQSCHSFEKGGPNKVGPNLYGIVGGPKAHLAGFGYSGAMKSAGGEWTFDDIDAFLDNPRGKVPGTAMAYAGLKRPDQRADLIAYLNQNSDKPLPLPAPEQAAEAPAPDGAAPTDGGNPPQNPAQ